MKTAFTYHRYSTDNQKDRYSLKIQRTITKKLAGKYNCKIIQVYEDKGISGATIEKRPDMLQLIEDLKELKPDYVICLDQDRLSRGNDFWYIKSLMAKSNTSLITDKEGVIDFSDITRDALSDMMGVFAKLERNMIARRIKRAIETRANAGKMLGNLTNIYGYDWKDKNIVINKGEAKVIKEIFDLYLKNNGYKTISLELNRRGIRGKRGGQVTAELIKYFLTNPVYKGYIRYDGTVLKGVHEPIIKEETFDKVQNKLANMKKYHKTKPAKYLLTGFLKCNNCGKNLGGSIKKLESGKRKPIYSCLGYRMGTCEKPTYVNAETIEKMVNERLLEFINSNKEKIKSKIKALAKDTKENPSTNIEAEKKRIELKLAKLLEEYLDGYQDKKTYRKKTLELKDELKELNKKLNKKRNSSGLKMLDGADLESIFGELDIERKRIVLSVFLDRVIIRRVKWPKESLKARASFVWNDMVSDS